MAGEGRRGHLGPSMTQDPFVLRIEVPASEGPRVNWVFKLCEFKPKGDKKKGRKKDVKTRRRWVESWNQRFVKKERLWSFGWLSWSPARKASLHITLSQRKNKKGKKERGCGRGKKEEPKKGREGEKKKGKKTIKNTKMIRGKRREKKKK